jgi:hypothetical protein
VKGITFRGRGKEFSETSRAKHHTTYGSDKSLILPSNPLNDLLNLWNKPEQYSAFFKFLHWGIIANSNRNAFSTQYGQANYFLRMILPSDLILHNVAFVNFTGRMHRTKTVGACSVPFVKVNITKVEDVPKTKAPLHAKVASGDIDASAIVETTRAKGKKVDVPDAPPFDPTNNFLEDDLFVCVNFMVSTSVAVCGMSNRKNKDLTVELVPILLPVNVKGLSGEEINDAEEFCCKDPQKIEDLYLIDMDPSRKLVDTNDYDSKLTNMSHPGMN